MYGLFSRQVECLSLQSVSLWSFQFEPVLDALFPIRTRYARIVHLGSLHHKRLAIEHEGVLADSKFLCRHYLIRQQKSQK